MATAKKTVRRPAAAPGRDEIPATKSTASPPDQPLTLPSLAAILQRKALEVRAIGRNRHDNPEHFMMRVDEVAASLVALANLIDKPRST